MNDNYENSNSSTDSVVELPINLRPTTPLAAAPVARKEKKIAKGGLLGLALSGTMMLGMVFGGAGAAAVNIAASGGTTTTATVTTAATATTSSATTASAVQTILDVAPNTIGSIYQQVSPSVVRITAVVQSGSGRTATSGEAIGTGIIVDDSGNILTNYHVIEDATSLTIQLSDGSEYTATVVGTAPQDDLALINATIPVDKLVVATLGDSSTVQVGDEVIAIGYPFGLDQSVTSGIISGLDRSETGVDGRALSGLIQTDTAINPGNSGGPLLNVDGEVIGINTMIESPVEGFTGVGLAIPVETVKELIAQLTSGGEVSRPWLGISGVEITSSLQAEYDLPVASGILVAEVTSGSPAAEAGIQAATSSGSQFGASQATQIGDIIVSIDGQQVAAVDDLTSYLNGKQTGDEVTLGIIRDGAEQSVTLTLQAWPAGTSSTSLSQG